MLKLKLKLELLELLKLELLELLLELLELLELPEQGLQQAGGGGAQTGWQWP